MEPIALTIIVPVYNELGSVDATVESLKRLRGSVADGVEVIFVDDGSDDGTGEALDGAVGAGVKVVHHGENRGYGAAIKTGLREASAQLVAITDADGTYPNERFGEFLREILDNGHDMVVGARTAPGARVPMIRRPAKWCLGKLANFLSGKKIPDLNSGMRIMKKSVVERFANILPDGFSFTTTITLAMLTSGCAVKFIPIDYRPRTGRSKIRPIYDTLNFIQLICRTTLYFNPLRVFVPMSLLLAAGAFLVLILSGLFAEKVMDVTFGVMLMSAVMVLAIGMLADLVDKRTQ